MKTMLGGPKLRAPSYIPKYREYADILFCRTHHSSWSILRITAVEFQRKFGEFQHQARREPVEITRHGRREWLLMSAEQLTG